MARKINFFKNHAVNEVGGLFSGLFLFFKKTSKNMWSALVLMYFDRPRLGHNNKNRLGGGTALFVLGNIFLTGLSWVLRNSRCFQVDSQKSGWFRVVLARFGMFYIWVCAMRLYQFKNNKFNMFTLTRFTKISAHTNTWVFIHSQVWQKN